MYAYALDGRGNRVFFDDANVPSLLAAPLVSDVSIDDPLYTRTRACVLSKNNAYYYRGRIAEGVGGPHTPGFVWPLAMIARALTSADTREAAAKCSASPQARLRRFDSRELRSERPQALHARRVRLGHRRRLPESIALVDRVTALENTGILLRAFERAVLLSVVGPESDD